MGIEPIQTIPQTGILPLNYIRLRSNRFERLYIASKATTLSIKLRTYKYKIFILFSWIEGFEPPIMRPRPIALPAWPYPIIIIIIKGIKAY